MLDRFEVVKAQERLSAVRSLLYLAHGLYQPGMDAADLVAQARENVFLLLELGVVESVIDLLGLEMERGRGMYEGSRSSITIADNLNLRVVLSLLYVILETASRQEPEDPPQWASLRAVFLEQLETPHGGGGGGGEETLSATLFTMLLAFCNGSMPHYPIKKILLLIWKFVLFVLGGLSRQEEVKKATRVAAGLDPTFPENTPMKPLVLPMPNFDPRGELSAAPPSILGRPLSIMSDTDGIGELCEGIKNHRFRPKARRQDVRAYIESCCAKYGCGEASEEDTTGFPPPIQESIKVLRGHIYQPLSEYHIEQEDKLERKRSLSYGREIPLPQRDTPTERLYHTLLPNLPQYMIALLKVLLAAAPTSRARNTDSLNILVDVLPPEQPASMAESNQVTLDINRHKEVIVKAVSATLLLLLKHFKVNHVYQFEYMGQHLVFANGIPLVLKFFNQNVSQYVAARNNFPTLNFPNCVFSPQDAQLTNDIVDSSTTDDGFCWRNLFSSINLLRILQKLTKWKHFRTVMLVMFRSAPILKRALKVRHPLTQLYILKLLKVQTRYLGRSWRRNNMKTISAIYRSVRHHLHDDWAYGNDLDAKPWDFQQQEFALKASIEKFNACYYHPNSPPVPSITSPNALLTGVGGEGGVAGDVANTVVEEDQLLPLDHNYLSTIAKEIQLSDIWKKKYEEWLEIEVFSAPHDWDKVLSSPHASMEIKAMEF